tara:strand:+ start:7568 stop:7912 length:345 start_codon:yes stop_codon:yes gene_type:complete
MITEKLKKHIAEQNIKTRKWMNSAPEGTYRIGTIYNDEDIKFNCDHYGISTVAEWKQSQAWEEYYEVFKDYNGVSPRWTNWKESTEEGWKKLTAELNDDIVEFLIEKKLKGTVI